MGNSNDDDWAMTRADFRLPKDEPASPASKPAGENYPQSPPSDWDKTAININIPPSRENDDWGITRANIAPPREEKNYDWDKTNLNLNLSSAARADDWDIPPANPGRAFREAPLPEPASRNEAQKKAKSPSDNSLTKWIYFVAGAFTMFLFMMIFLAIIFFAFLYK